MASHTEHEVGIKRENRELSWYRYHREWADRYGDRWHKQDPTLVVNQEISVFVEKYRRDWARWGWSRGDGEICITHPFGAILVSWNFLRENRG